MIKMMMKMKRNWKKGKGKDWSLNKMMTDSANMNHYQTLVFIAKGEKDNKKKMNFNKRTIENYLNHFNCVSTQHSIYI